MPPHHQVEARVEPYELVELFYGSGSGTPTSPPTLVPKVSPQHSTGTSSPEVMQVRQVCVCVCVCVCHHKGVA